MGSPMLHHGLLAPQPAALRPLQCADPSYFYDKFECQNPEHLSKALPALMTRFVFWGMKGPWFHCGYMVVSWYNHGDIMEYIYIYTYIYTYNLYYYNYIYIYII
jgi:hypothetical protein